MRTFTVHANASLPREDAHVRFVKEGIAGGALISPLIWFLFHRMWWEAGFSLGLALLIAFGGAALALDENVTLVAGLLFQVLIAVEANDLRRLALARAAYRPVAVVHGVDAAEAELRFFSNWKGPLPIADIGATTSAVFDHRGETGSIMSRVTGPKQTIWPNTPVQPTNEAARPSDEEVLGLFPKPQS